MKNKIVIGKFEAFCIIVNAIGAKIYLSYPRNAAEAAGTAGWIFTLYTSLLAVIGFIIISKLYTRFEGKDLLDIGEYVGGKTGKIIVGILILAFLLFLIPLILREFGEEMKIISLPISPISYVSIFFLSGALVATFLGIESISRISSLIVVAVAIGFVIIFLGVLPTYDVSNLVPILGNGAKDIIVKGTPRVSTYSELIYLFMLTPFLKTYKNFSKVGYWSLGISASLLIISSLCYQLFIPYPTNLEPFLPVYNMSRSINFGRFFQRVEPIFLTTWAATGLLYVSTGFFFIVYTFKKIFNLEYLRPLILPFAVIVFTISMLPQNLMNTDRVITSFFRDWSWTVTFGMTILLLVIARFVKKGKKAENA